MSKVRSIAELPPARCRTIVINVHTDLLATRALLSARRLSTAAICLVNCDPTPGSRDHFDGLAAELGFDVVEQRTVNHGEALDRLFRASPDRALLLLDSDAELRTAGYADRLVGELDNPRCFGAGFLWGPFMLDGSWAIPAGAEVLYAERPWIPCAAFDVALVRSALDAGLSFNASVSGNEVAAVPRVANALGARWEGPWATRSDTFERLPGWLRRPLRGRPLRGLRPLRRPYHGNRPHLVVRDTGGAVYEHLRYERGLSFAGGPVDLIDGEVHHYLGVTRHVLWGPHALDTAPEDVEEEVVERLRSAYGYVWPASAAPVTST